MNSQLKARGEWVAIILAACAFICTMIFFVTDVPNVAWGALALFLTAAMWAYGNDIKNPILEMFTTDCWADLSDMVTKVTGPIESIRSDKRKT